MTVTLTRLQQLWETRAQGIDHMARGRRTIVVLVAAAGAVAFLVIASSSAPFAAGTLNLRATLGTLSLSGMCPPEAPPGADCHPRTSTGSVSGLGSVSAKYTWFFGIGDCPSTLVKTLATTGRLVVAGKGEIDFALADGARCVEQEPVRNEPQDFTITGGTGTYQGASGGGTVERSLSGGYGVERWTGTLTVSGLSSTSRRRRSPVRQRRPSGTRRAPNASASHTRSRRGTPLTGRPRLPVCRGRAVGPRSADNRHLPGEGLERQYRAGEIRGHGQEERVAVISPEAR